MKLIRWITVGLTAITLGFALQTLAADGDTVKAIKARGELICGADGKHPGFSAPDGQGVWRGFDVDFCRVVAAAILGDANKLKYIALAPVQRFASLQSGEIDMLLGVTTYTLTRDASLRLDFAPVNFYSGTKIITHNSLGVQSAKELDGAAMCIPPGSSRERAIADFFRKQGISYRPVVIDNIKELGDAYLAERCDAMANFEPDLALIRLRAQNPDAHMILPEDIEKEPLAPAVRQGDDHFRDIVSWSVYATFEAEEWGITSRNIDEMRMTDNPRIQRFLGLTDDLGEKLGVSNDWAYQIIKQVGNYEEIFENNIGKRTPLRLERGLNRLWIDGGLLYSPPFQ